MYVYNAEPPIAIPIYRVLPYCVITVERITGEALSTAILSRLNACGLDVSKCRGQGYDGASTMSSSRVGVQKRIADVAPLAFYTHYQSHQLNICVVKACSIPQIRNASLVVSDISSGHQRENTSWLLYIIEAVSEEVKKCKHQVVSQGPLSHIYYFLDLPLVYENNVDQYSCGKVT